MEGDANYFLLTRQNTKIPRKSINLREEAAVKHPLAHSPGGSEIIGNLLAGFNSIFSPVQRSSAIHFIFFLSS